jgi:hypothetical protein
MSSKSQFNTIQYYFKMVSPTNLTASRRSSNGPLAILKNLVEIYLLNFFVSSFLVLVHCVNSDSYWYHCNVLAPEFTQ